MWVPKMALLLYTGMSLCKSLFKVRWEYFGGGGFMFKCLPSSACGWIFVSTFPTLSGLVSERATVQICEHVLPLQLQRSCCKSNYLCNTTSQCLFFFFLDFQTELPGRLWGCVGSLGMLECEEMKWPTSSQGTFLFSGVPRGGGV